MDRKLRIQNLLLEKFSKTIAVDDEQLVDELIAHDPEVKAMWVETLTRLQSKKGEHFFKNIDENAAWMKLSPELSDTSAKKNLFYKKAIGLAASMAIFLCLFIYYSGKRHLLVSTKKAETINLKLANGEIIDLNSTVDRTISLKSVNLNASSKALKISGKSPSDVSWNVLNVPAKLDYHIILEDGTEIWLNSVSSLRFPFNFANNKREVYLTGEAFFKVTKNAEKPFIVYSGNARIKVLGTSFNINSYSEGTIKTSLVEGSVQATYRNKNMMLNPGYELLCSDGKEMKIQPFDEALTLAWMKGTYFFQNDNLGEIKEIIPRWYGVDVVLDDPALANLPFSGAIIKKDPLNNFLENLKTTAGLSSYYKDGVWHLK